MRFNLARMFVAAAILAATMALSRLIGSVPVALLIGTPVAAIALIAKREHVRPIVRTVLSCAFGAFIASLFVGGDPLGHRAPEGELGLLIVGAVIAWIAAREGRRSSSSCGRAKMTADPPLTPPGAGTPS